MMHSVYPANFALQAIALSAFALGVAWLLQRCERRAAAALVGLLACGLIPFFTASGPVKESLPKSQVIRIQPLPPIETGSRTCPGRNRAGSNRDCRESHPTSGQAPGSGFMDPSHLGGGKCVRAGLHVV
jgi:hypothetical protein